MAKTPLNPNIHRIACILQTLSGLCDCCGCDENGNLVLGPGTHQMSITTANPPTNVKLSIISADLPVCQGNVDMVGYTTDQTGFVLYADIKSNTCEIVWCVDY